MNEAILGSELEQVRKAAKISQADVATKLGVDQSRVSRMEKDTKVPLDEAREYLAALGGNSTAKDFIEHIDSTWYSIPKPGFQHPCRAVLRTADSALARLQSFLADPTTPPDVAQQGKLYESVLRETCTYLLDLRHSVAMPESL